MKKLEILQQAHQQRVDEVEMYQINIDNYNLAIAEIEKANDVDLDGFKDQLKTLLKSEIIEQKKSKVMLAVIKMQLEM